MALPLVPLRRILMPTEADFVGPAANLGLAGVDLPPEAQPVVASPAAVGAPAAADVDWSRVGGVAPDNSTVGGAPAIDFSRLSRPVYDTQRTGRARLAGLIAAGVGGISALATGRVTPLAAIASGIASGAQGAIAGEDARYAAAGEAYQDAVRRLTEKEADLTNDALDRRTQEEIATANRTAADARNLRTVEGQKYGYDLAFRTQQERAAAAAASEATDRLEGQLKALMDNGGTVENMTPIVRQVLNLPDTPEGLQQAASIAQSFRTDYDTGVALDRSAEARGWRSLSLTAAGQAEQARHNRVSEANAAASGGGDTAAETREEADRWQFTQLSELQSDLNAGDIDQEEYDRQAGEIAAERRRRLGTYGDTTFSNLLGVGAPDYNDPATVQRLIDGGMTPAQVQRLANRRR